MPHKPYHRYLSFILFLSSFTAVSQRYEFDTFVEYEYVKDNKSKPEKTFEFTYSKDNSYLLSVIDKDKKNFVLTFLSADGKEAVMTVSKEDFLKEESTTVSCSATKKINLTDIEKSTTDFNYIQLNDTIIRKDTLQHYMVKSRKKDFHMVRHYIIQNDTGFHLPNITPGTAPYFKWKKIPIMPKGLFKETFIMKDDEILEKMMMLKYTKRKKILIIERGCQY